MANFNRVILMGNVTREIELRYLQSGMAVTDMAMAMNHRYKNQSGEWAEEPVFVDVTLWGRTAEVASEYLSKGSPVFIEGRLKLDTWETDGQKKSKLRVVGERMQLIGGRNDRQGGGGASSDQSEYNEPAAASTAAAGPSDGGGPPKDDIPF
ncbi:MAG: single-stranded DNA-binding protein [Planctomycetaceae bacterium]|nr:single-stranded DNA-binding protein [Planctomycetaceae bacterium]